MQAGSPSASRRALPHLESTFDTIADIYAHGILQYVPAMPAHIFLQTALAQFSKGAKLYPRN